MKTVKAVILGLLIILIVVFTAQNLETLSRAETLRLDLVFHSFQTPPIKLVFLLAAAFVLGYLVAFSAGLIQKRKLKKTIKGLQRRQFHTEEELDSLRNLPVTGDTGGTLQQRPNRMEVG